MSLIRWQHSKIWRCE